LLLLFDVRCSTSKSKKKVQVQVFYYDRKLRGKEKQRQAFGMTISLVVKAIFVRSCLKKKLSNLSWRILFSRNFLLKIDENKNKKRYMKLATSIMNSIDF